MNPDRGTRLAGDTEVFHIHDPQVYSLHFPTERNKSIVVTHLSPGAGVLRRFDRGQDLDEEPATTPRESMSLSFGKPGTKSGSNPHRKGSFVVSFILYFLQEGGVFGGGWEEVVSNILNAFLDACPCTL